MDQRPRYGGIRAPGDRRGELLALAGAHAGGNRTDTTATVGGGGVAATLIHPAVPETAMAVPAGDAARVLLRLTGVVVAVPVNVIVTTATTPLANVVWLTPEAAHVYPAATAAHEMVLPAAFADGPAATLMWDTLAAG